MSNMVFVTGSTGLIGANLAARILRQDPQAHLFALVRGSTASSATERFWSALSLVDDGIDAPVFRKRVTILTGDISENKLGMTDTHYHKVASSVTHIIHSAASVDFQLPLEEARRINCEGTAHVLSLAKAARGNGRFRLFAYVSTAYVSGNREGTIREDELKLPPEFSNSYEHSKFEAEHMVQEQKETTPTVILRPSIVVGDSLTGVTTAFNVLYPPLKYIFLGYVPCLPGSPSTPIDVVPVDYVRDAAYHIIFRARNINGKTFHLSAGPESISTTGGIVRQSVATFNDRFPKQRVSYPYFLPKTLFASVLKTKKGGAAIARLLSIYESYLCFKRMFDTTQTQLALAGSGIAVPRFSEYRATVLGYFLQSMYRRSAQKAA